jgi:hypothetical protein
MSDNRLPGISHSEIKRILNKGNTKGVASLTDDELPIYKIGKENQLIGVPNYGSVVNKKRGGTFKGTF